MIALLAFPGMALAALPNLVRMAWGPSLVDRALCLGSLTSKLSLCVAAASVLAGRADLADVALYMIIAAIVTQLALLKYIGMRSLQPPLGMASVEEA